MVKTILYVNSLLNYNILSGLILCLLSGVSVAQDQWVQKDSVNGKPRSVASAFVADGEGYIVGGLDEDGFRRKMYSYTVWQDDWDDEESLGGPNETGLDRGNATSFAVAGKGYVCLGQGETNDFFKDLWEYDPATQVWSQKADFIGTPRRQAVGFAVWDTAYVGLGRDQNGFCKDFYKYDHITNTWSQINDFGGTARKEAVGFTMGAKAYVGTGDDGVYRNDFWEYNPLNDSWTQKTDFPGTPRKGAVGWGIFPTAYIATGDDGSYRKDVYSYNFYTEQWTQMNDFMGSGRSNAIAFVINNIVFLGTGYNGEFLDDFYGYNPVVGLSEKQADNIIVFPNPSSGSFTVRSLLSRIQVFSMDGINVTDAFEIDYLPNEIKLNPRGISPGSYLIELQNETTREIRKVTFQ